MSCHPSQGLAQHFGKHGCTGVWRSSRWGDMGSVFYLAFYHASLWRDQMVTEPVFPSQPPPVQGALFHGAGGKTQLSTGPEPTARCAGGSHTWHLGALVRGSHLGVGKKWSPGKMGLRARGPQHVTLLVKGTSAWATGSSHLSPGGQGQQSSAGDPLQPFQRAGTPTPSIPAAS